MQQNISETLRQILNRFAPRKDGELRLTDSTLLITDLGIDSPRMIDILLDIEDHFRVTIDDTQFQEVKTFGDLVALIDGLLEKSA